MFSIVPRGVLVEIKGECWMDSVFGSFEGAFGKDEYCVVIGWIEGYAYIALSILLL